MDDVEPTLKSIQMSLKNIHFKLREMHRIMATLIELQAAVSSQSAEIQTAVSEFTRVDALVTQLLAADLPPAAQAIVNDLQSQMATTTTALHIAIATSAGTDPATPLAAA